MALTFSELQAEVLRRATKSQSGTNYDTAVKNAINFSLKRISREAKWRQLRRSSSFSTVTKYTTGSGAGTFTNGSKNITVTGATFITDGIQPGRIINLQGDSTVFKVETITGETTLTLDQNYTGTTINGTGTYSIAAKEEYNLPIQSSHRMFIWHEQYGYPYTLNFITDHDFLSSGLNRDTTAIPTHYRMWGYDMTLAQPIEPSVVTINSSSSSDTSINITVFGTVSGYPDYEIISTNASDGTTNSSGSKLFSSIERITKGASTVGRITATTNSQNVTISVIPVGDTSIGINYSKIKLYPLPNSVFTINVYYYKEIYDLINSGDVHELGADFDEAIILLSASKIDYETNKVEADRFFQLYKDEISNLKKTNIEKPDWFPKLMRSNRRSKSSMITPFFSKNQAGAYY